MRGLRVFRRIFRYYRDHLPATIGGTASVVASALIALAVPGLVRRSVDALTSGAPIEIVWRLAGLLLLVAVASGSFLFLQRLLLVTVSRHLEHALRVDLYNHLLRLPAAFYMRERVGDLLTRATSDIGAVRMAVGPSLMYAVNTVTVMIAATALMARIDPLLTACSLAIVPVVAATTGFFLNRVHARWGRAQEALSRFTARLQEHLVGLRVLRAYVCEETEKGVLAARNLDYLQASRRLISIQASVQPVLQTLVGLGFVVVLGLGGNLVRTGRITLGQFVEFNLYLVRLTWPMVAVGYVATMIQRGAASMTRIEQLFAEPPLDEPAMESGAARIADSDATLCLRNLSFTYPNTVRPAVGGVSFSVAAGERVAIVGGVGSGKSTILSLVPRLLEPPPGTVFLDGRDVRELPLAILRREVSLVPQGNFLFSATLRDNIALAHPEASEDEILAAAIVAGLEEDLHRFPSGLDTMVGERGVTLSGGQQQRVAIARAILTEPRLLLLDDCLSAVDTTTERVILSLLPRTTLLFATHRLAAAELCDRVVVMDAGRVIESGTPAELAAIGGRYAKLLALQRLSRADLANSATAG